MPRAVSSKSVADNDAENGAKTDSTDYSGLLLQLRQELAPVLQDLIAGGEVTREELFVVSKCFQTHHVWEGEDRPREALAKTLKDLRLSRVDLYLMHWPFAWEHIGPELEWGASRSRMPVDEEGDARMADVPLQETWRAMEALVDSGLVKRAPQSFEELGTHGACDGLEPSVAAPEWLHTRP